MLQRLVTPRPLTSIWGLLALLAAADGCRRIELEMEPPQTGELKAANTKAEAPAPPAPPAATASLPQDATKVASSTTATTAEPEPSGWSPLSLRDTLPICAFSSIPEREKAQHIRAAKRQVLRSNAKVVFGVYGPWCLNEACDERPTLQCWTETRGDTVVVHTRYSSRHKDGASCRDGCLEVDASCETDELPPGKYTIRHGDTTYPLRIPSTLRDPCFNRPHD